MRKLRIIKARKSSSFNTYDSFISFLFVIIMALFKLKMVVSVFAKSTRKILYPWRLLGTKFNEVLLVLFYIKASVVIKCFQSSFLKGYSHKGNYIIS